ncbi:hypothetical protein ATE49_05150 [Elizabethkingia miricola]|uniref:Ketosteroid isomerase-like protein n=1 Tax=Elizabethkingia miricola TaxID=172045 RepID=A0ABY3NH08_ELIMR|nr:MULTISPECIES: nuclear transport factor 2 family protein [Elizabethkingia]OBS12608.1 hypothetical protein ATE49_05150 [Elizabethkingia miricola]TYO91906.1 ketosteroid isomerase-like protein [Elizabethkingia miricola]
MNLDETTYTGSKDPQEVAKFVCNAVNGWTEDPKRMIPYFTADGNWEFPYAPEEFGLFFKELKGPDVFSKYFSSLTPYMENLNVGPGESWKAIATEKPDVYLFQYEGTAIIKPTGKLYTQSYISLVTMEKGKIKTYREYWNPYVALVDFGLAVPVMP